MSEVRDNVKAAIMAYLYGDPENAERVAEGVLGALYAEWVGPVEARVAALREALSGCVDAGDNLADAYGSDLYAHEAREQWWAAVEAWRKAVES